MTARKTARAANKAPDFALMQKRVGDAMWALPLWLPDNVLEDYIPARAEEYAYMLHVLAYNMKRVMRILGIGELMAAMRA